jgi:signal transduction histidine kinase
MRGYSATKDQVLGRLRRVEGQVRGIPFQRLHRTADHDHHGLGLSIVRAIAAAHGGTVSAEPQRAGGLLVEVTFDRP